MSRPSRPSLSNPAHRPPPPLLDESDLWPEIAPQTTSQSERPQGFGCRSHGFNTPSSSTALGAAPRDRPHWQTRRWALYEPIADISSMVSGRPPQLVPCQDDSDFYEADEEDGDEDEADEVDKGPAVVQPRVGACKYCSQHKMLCLFQTGQDECFHCRSAGRTCVDEGLRMVWGAEERNMLQKIANDPKVLATFEKYIDDPTGPAPVNWLSGIPVLSGTFSPVQSPRSARLSSARSLSSRASVSSLALSAPASAEETFRKFCSKILSKTPLSDSESYRHSFPSAAGRSYNFPALSYPSDVLLGISRPLSPSAISQVSESDYRPRSRRSRCSSRSRRSYSPPPPPARSISFPAPASPILSRSPSPIYIEGMGLEMNPRTRCRGRTRSNTTSSTDPRRSIYTSERSRRSNVILFLGEDSDLSDLTDLSIEREDAGIPRAAVSSRGSFDEVDYALGPGSASPSLEFGSPTFPSINMDSGPPTGYIKRTRSNLSASPSLSSRSSNCGHWSTHEENESQLLFVGNSLHPAQKKRRLGIRSSPRSVSDYPPSERSRRSPLVQSMGGYASSEEIMDADEEALYLSSPRSALSVPQESSKATTSVIVTSSMTVSEVKVVLGDHGCVDLTDILDHQSCSEWAVSQGGFSDIHSGKLNDGTLVAIKALRLLSSSDESGKQLKHAARELHTWSKCRHLNVLELLGLVDFRGRIGMVSPWMPNGSVRLYLATYPHTNRCELCYGISDGLAYLHEASIVHGDLKGANVLLSNTGIPKLTDFGNSALRDCSMQYTKTNSETSISPRWTAPEIFNGGKHSYSADVFALGMTLLETITGDIPYHELEQDLAVIMAIGILKKLPKRSETHIPSKSEQGDILWALFTKCWSYLPEDRPTAAEIRDEVKWITPQGLV